MAKVENYNGYPAIMVDGKPYPPMMATIRTNNRDHMIIDEEYYKNLGKSGIKIYFLICDTEWLKPQGFEMFCEEAEKLLTASFRTFCGTSLSRFRIRLWRPTSRTSKLRGA